VCRSKHVEPSINFGLINSITKLHPVGISVESSMKHGSMNMKFINAKQAIEIHAYKNTKRKLYKTNTAIWFNKTYRDKELTPNYIRIKINDNH
jgi:hypothetical protein